MSSVEPCPITVSAWPRGHGEYFKNTPKEYFFCFARAQLWATLIVSRLVCLSVCPQFFQNAYFPAVVLTQCRHMECLYAVLTDSPMMSVMTSWHLGNFKWLYIWNGSSDRSLLVWLWFFGIYRFCKGRLVVVHSYSVLLPYVVSRHASVHFPTFNTHIFVIL